MYQHNNHESDQVDISQWTDSMVGEFLRNNDL